MVGVWRSMPLGFQVFKLFVFQSRVIFCVLHVQLSSIRLGFYLCIGIMIITFCMLSGTSFYASLVISVSLIRLPFLSFLLYQPQLLQ